MTEQVEVKIRKLMSIVDKDELEEILLTVISISSHNKDILMEKTRGMSSIAQALLIAVMLEMMVRNAEEKGRREGGEGK